jgi:hypothetical protein
LPPVRGSGLAGRLAPYGAPSPEGPPWRSCLKAV